MPVPRRQIPPMPSIVWIDGTWYDRGSAVVSVFDHGLLYGDGVFEGIRAYGGRVFRLVAKDAGIAGGVDEVIRFASAGYVAEASGMNLFAVSNGSVRTPPPYTGILRGVTRDTVVELRREAGYGVEELPMNRYDLYTADEVFLTGTAAEIVGISKLDGRAIGKGVAGPVTRDLATRFRAYVTRDD